MSHRGPRKQQYPGVDGVSSSRNSSRRGKSPSENPFYDLMSPPNDALTMEWAFNMLESRAGNLPKRFPLSGDPQQIAAAFLLARSLERTAAACVNMVTNSDRVSVINDSFGDPTDWRNSGKQTMRDALLEYAYQTVRDVLRTLRSQHGSVAAMVASPAPSGSPAVNARKQDALPPKRRTPRRAYG